MTHYSFSCVVITWLFLTSKVFCYCSGHNLVQALICFVRRLLVLLLCILCLLIKPLLYYYQFLMTILPGFNDIHNKWIMIVSFP